MIQRYAKCTPQVTHSCFFFWATNLLTLFASRCRKEFYTTFAEIPTGLLLQILHAWYELDNDNKVNIHRCMVYMLAQLLICLHDIYLFYLQINHMDDMVETMSSLGLDCVDTLSNIRAFLGTLLSLEDIRSDKMVSFSLKDMDAQQVILRIFCQLSFIVLI